MGIFYKLYPQRFLSLAFLAVPYYLPGQRTDLDATKALTDAEIGFERLGYIRLFVQDTGWKLMDEHVSDSPIRLVSWITALGSGSCAEPSRKRPS